MNLDSRGIVHKSRDNNIIIIIIMRCYNEVEDDDEDDDSESTHPRQGKLIGTYLCILIFYSSKVIYVERLHLAIRSRYVISAAESAE